MRNGRDKQLNRSSMGRSWRWLTVLACVAIGGCVAGPDFEPSAPPEASSYGAHTAAATVATPSVAGGEAQRFVSGADLAGDWWTLFHSRRLDALIDEALADNHDLKAAKAALLAAHEQVLAQRGAYFPTVGASFGASRQQQTGVLAPPLNSNALEYSLFTPQVSVSYVPDVFGLNRRSVESAQAQADAARYQMIATDLTLTTNVANAYIQEAALEDQIDATRQVIEIDGKLVEALKYQLEKGYASGLDLAAQQTQLAQAAAGLPPLVKQAEQQRDLIAVLTGRYPDQSTEEPASLAALTLPGDLPLSLPSTLVSQRPDVLQAESNQHAASAQIGIAAANRLPNVELTANLGSTALTLGEVFGSGAGFWGLAPTIAEPIFDGGTLLHRERAAKATYVQASEQYRSTVLTALQNVADTLAALDQDARTLKATAAAADAAKVTLDLSERQWKDGYASYLSLLSAEQAYQQARIGLVQAQASRYADTVALFQALGGGWWRRSDLAKSADAH
jgi:NodT family efflux transporter outer membrane factor (OMF) lipoprotein